MPCRSWFEVFVVLVFFIGSLASMPAVAQQPQQQTNPAGDQMPGMQHEHGKSTMPQSLSKNNQHHHGMKMQPTSLVENVLQHSTSGTSAEPNSTPMPMLMTTVGNWSLMFHGVGWIEDVQQSGPRGRDKFFSTNWFMPMAQHQLGPGQITLRTMVSLEPGTVTNQQYPELFQVGETAFGKPIVDGQHPHDFFMEIAALYDVKLGEDALLSFYAAPVGDPAMGPTAYPHRISAAENPMAALGHHLEDSTHIVDDVITAGVTYKRVRLEASGFHGREPDEDRWDVDAGRIDSWSMRATVNPAQNWSAQYAIGHLTSPEVLNPQEDVRRMTASVIYNRPFAHGNWATTLLWGRNQNLVHPQVFNGYLAESTVALARQSFWGRVENVDRTNEILFGENPEPPGFEERFAARVQAYTVGYDHELGHVPHLSIALGGQFTLYGKPAFLDSIYGNHPVGGVVFLRIRPISSQGQHH